MSRISTTTNPFYNIHRFIFLPPTLLIIRRDSPSSCRSFLGTPTVEWLFDRSLTSYLLPSERTMSLIINNDTVQGGKGTSTASTYWNIVKSNASRLLILP